MKYFELELESRGTTYFGGQEHPKMLDYMMWPWLERAEIIPLIDDRLELLPKSSFPLLVTLLISYQGQQTLVFCPNYNVYLSPLFF